MNDSETALAERLEVAIGLALQAADEIMRIAKTGVTKSRKADNTLVTNADHRSDELIRNGLLDVFPGDGILTEESGESGIEESGLVWVVDPLDGTNAFARQIAGFSVMIGLLQDNNPVLGVVADPLEGWLYFATAGGGAFGVAPGESKRERLLVSDRNVSADMTLVASPGMSSELDSAFIREFSFKRGHRINSVGIKVGLLVRGLSDVYFNHHSVSYWDTVAPLAIALEAGAEATMLGGEPFLYDFSNDERLHHGPSLFTNGTCHEEIRSRISAIVCGTAFA